VKRCFGRCVAAFVMLGASGAVGLRLGRSLNRRLHVWRCMYWGTVKNC
jgi:hypothetical protein